MRDILLAVYPWTKTLHIVSMVAWIAGLFYLPRLFVYHTEKAPPGSETSAIFKVMERRLLRAIMTPAAVSTWVFGGLLLMTPGIIDWRSDLWIYPKLAAVGGLSWFHLWLGWRCQDFDEDQNGISGRVYRMMNEIPTVALIVIVIMVVVRPM